MKSILLTVGLLLFPTSLQSDPLRLPPKQSISFCGWGTLQQTSPLTFERGYSATECSKLPLEVWYQFGEDI